MEPCCQHTYYRARWLLPTQEEEGDKEDKEDREDREDKEDRDDREDRDDPEDREDKEDREPSKLFLQLDAHFFVYEPNQHKHRLNINSLLEEVHQTRILFVKLLETSLQTIGRKTAKSQ